MPASAPFVAHCLELLAPLGAVRAKRMFGGHGLYVDSLFIALIAGERLYLKSDDRSRSAFEHAGCDAVCLFAQRPRRSDAWLLERARRGTRVAAADGAVGTPGAGLGVAGPGQQAGTQIPQARGE